MTRITIEQIRKLPNLSIYPSTQYAAFDYSTPGKCNFYFEGEAFLAATKAIFVLKNPEQIDVYISIADCLATDSDTRKFISKQQFLLFNYYHPDDSIFLSVDLGVDFKSLFSHLVESGSDCLISVTTYHFQIVSYNVKTCDTLVDVPQTNSQILCALLQAC